MVPLFNVSLSGIGVNVHGRKDFLNSTVSFSLSARSYNDKYESWEPLVEPVDGLLRYSLSQTELIAVFCILSVWPLSIKKKSLVSLNIYI